MYLRDPLNHGKLHLKYYYYYSCKYEKIIHSLWSYVFYWLLIVANSRQLELIEDMMTKTLCKLALLPNLDFFFHNI